VHHKEGYSKDDNRYPETLELLPSQSRHHALTIMSQYITRLEKMANSQAKRIIQLEAEMVLIRKQIPNNIGFDEINTLTYSLKNKI